MKPTEPKGYSMKGYPDETKDENKHHIDLRREDSRFTAAVSYLQYPANLCTHIDRFYVLDFRSKMDPCK